MFREFVAARQRAEQDFHRDLSLAWHIEAMHRQKRLPDLQALLRPRGKQTTAQLRAVMAGVSAQFGMQPRRVRLIPRTIEAYG